MPIEKSSSSPLPCDVSQAEYAETKIMGYTDSIAPACPQCTTSGGRSARNGESATRAAAYASTGSKKGSRGGKARLLKGCCCWLRR
eukprot:3514119-Amphidinium_carterae.1